MPKEYIDRDVAIEKFKENCVGCESYGGVLCAACPLYNAFLQLDMIPAADVAPVVHGYNLDKEWPSLFQCSVCKWSCSDTIPGDTAEYNYCPNCGAKMDGGKE